MERISLKLRILNLELLSSSLGKVGMIKWFTYEILQNGRIRQGKLPTRKKIENEGFSDLKSIRIRCRDSFKKYIICLCRSNQWVGLSSCLLLEAIVLSVLARLLYTCVHYLPTGDSQFFFYPVQTTFGHVYPQREFGGGILCALVDVLPERRMRNVPSDYCHFA